MKLDKKKIFIIGFIVFLGVVNVCVWIAPLISTIPVNGFCHRARSISFNEEFGIPVMGDLDQIGLSEAEVAELSTAGGYPFAGTTIGVDPGADGPWPLWTDWEDNDSFMGKELNADEDIFLGMKSFSYVNVWYVDLPEDGEYYICAGSDDGNILYMDGERISEYLTGERSCQLDDDVIQKNLTAGRHYFCMIVYQVTSTTGFTFRIKNATNNATHFHDVEDAPVMLLDYKSKTSIDVNIFGIITGALSVALVLALVMVDHFTKKRI